MDDKSMNIKSSKLHALLFIFLFIVFYFLMSYLLVEVFVGYASSKGVSIDNYLIPTIVIPSFLLFGLPPILYCLIKRVSIVDSLKLHKLSGKNFMYSLVIGLLLIPISSAISLVLQFVFPNPIQTTLDETITYGLPVALLALAVTPAICEELMFRGLFFYRFRNLKPIYIALISGLTFGFVHLNVVQGVYAAVIGFCFFYLVYYTNSIFSSMIAHFVINGTNVTLLYLVSLIPTPETTEPVPTTPSMSVTTFYIVLACICSYLVYKLLKRVKANNQGNFIDLNAEQIN